MKKRQIQILGKILFILYIIFLLWFLIISDWYGRDGVLKEYHYNLIPFTEMKRFWRYREQLGVWSAINLLGNVLIFVPFGFFEAIASQHRSFWAIMLDGFFVSLLVEVFQFLAKVGRFDVDDLILNTSGVIIGYIVFLIGNTIRRKYGTKRTKQRKRA